MCVCALDMRNKIFTNISAETTIEMSKLKAVIVTLHYSRSMENSIYTSLDLVN